MLIFYKSLGLESLVGGSDFSGHWARKTVDRTVSKIQPDSTLEYQN